MIDQNPYSLYCYYIKWMDRLNVNTSYDEYLKFYCDLNSITKIVKLRNFQYRLLCDKILTNDRLYHWKIKESQECEWCAHHKQTIMHLLLECNVSKNVWSFVNNLFLNKRKFTPSEIIFNNAGTVVKHLENFVILMTKYLIFQQKCLGTKLTTPLLKKELLFYRGLELMYATSTKQKKNR